MVRWWFLSIGRETKSLGKVPCGCLCLVAEGEALRKVPYEFLCFEVGGEVTRGGCLWVVDSWTGGKSLEELPWEFLYLGGGGKSLGEVSWGFLCF